MNCESYTNHILCEQNEKLDQIIQLQNQTNHLLQDQNSLLTLVIQGEQYIIDVLNMINNNIVGIGKLISHGIGVPV